MSIHSKQIPFVVVQCPSNGDADFASRWLATAVEADRILAQHRKANPEFERAIEPLVSPRRCPIFVGCNGVRLAFG